MSTQDDYSAVRQLLRAFKGLTQLQGVLERAATLEGTIPRLETRRTELEQAVAVFAEKVAALQKESSELEAAVISGRRRRDAELRDALRDLDRAHSEEVAEKRRLHALALTQLGEERQVADMDLRATLKKLSEARETLKTLSDRIAVGAGS